MSMGAEDPWDLERTLQRETSILTNRRAPCGLETSFFHHPRDACRHAWESCVQGWASTRPPLNRPLAATSHGCSATHPRAGRCTVRCRPCYSVHRDRRRCGWPTKDRNDEQLAQKQNKEKWLTGEGLAGRNNFVRGRDPSTQRRVRRDLQLGYQSSLHGDQ